MSGTLSRASGTLQTTTSYARLLAEDVADLLAGDHDRGRPAYVTGLEAVLRGPREVDLDVELRDVGVQVDVLVDHPVDAARGSSSISAACSPRVCRSWPKSRMMIGSLPPATTSLVRSSR